MKVVAVTTVNGPYINARYQYFSESEPNYSLVLLEFGRTSSEYEWSTVIGTITYSREVLFDIPVEDVERSRRATVIFSALDRLQPDVLIVCGYGVTAMINVIFWAVSQHRAVPLVLLSDSQEIDFRRYRYLELLKKRVIGLFGSALVAGSSHNAYLKKLGMNANSIFVGYDVVDNRYFQQSAQHLRQDALIPTRDLKLPRPYFLCTARFINKKNLLNLIRAYNEYRLHGKDVVGEGTLWDLVILGDGALKPVLESLREELNLIPYVHLPGFKQYAELPRFYAFAGCFVLPSTSEQWGLVVNEAMASGLPVLVSDRCGCAPELVRNGENGFTFDPHDTDALARLMCRIASPDCDRAVMGRVSLEIVSHWSLETFARGLDSAVRAALKVKRRRASLLDKVLLKLLSLR